MQIRKRKQNKTRFTELKLVFCSDSTAHASFYIHAYNGCIGITALNDEGRDTYKIHLNQKDLLLLKEAIEYTSLSKNNKDGKTFYNKKG